MTNGFPEPFYEFSMAMAFTREGITCTIQGKVVSLDDFSRAVKKQSQALSAAREAEANLIVVMREISEGNYD